MKLRCASALFLLAAASTTSGVLSACGGGLASDGDGASGDADGGTNEDANGGSDGGSRSDAGFGTSADGGTTLGAPCPSTAPLFGSSCPRPGLTCEYGGVGPLLLCSTMFTCGDQGQWLSNAGAKDCTGSETDNAASCPATYDALPPGAECPGGDTRQSARCVYAQGECECGSCFLPDGGNTSNGAAWTCRAFPKAEDPSCPTPRPRAGTPCASEGQTCDYASVCTSLDFGLPALKCTGGLWQSLPVEQPPCALPTCGH